MGNDLFGKDVSVRKPPSLAYKTLTNFLEQFQSSPIPSHIDRDFLPTSMSGATQASLISALKFLRLIGENGVPEDNLHNLVKATKDERVVIWRGIMTSAYDFLLSNVDIERTTTRIVSDKFKEQGISGDTIRKAMTFLIFAANDAGIKVSPHVKPYHATGKSNVRTRKPESKPEKDSQEETNGSGESDSFKPEVKRKPISESPYQVLIDILNVDMDEEEQKAVWTLIRYLKKQDAKGSE